MGIDTNGKNNNILNSDAVAVETFNIAVKDIENLSGIEAFTALTHLNCFFNQLTSLDVSANMALASLDCSANSLTSLNVSENTGLTGLYCGSNQLTRLNVSTNADLTVLYCNSNQLTSLNIKNEANGMLAEFSASSNPGLTCIQVDDVSSNVLLSWTKDATASYSENCTTALSNEDFELSGVSVFPNPTADILNITVVEKQSINC